MKKKRKIVLVVLIGVLLLVGITFGVVLLVDYTDEPASGAMVEGTGTEDWRRYSVDIPYKTMCEDKFYTNMEGDYLTDVYFYYSGGYVVIDYYDWFYFFDDFEAVFVFSNKKSGDELVTYTTDISVSHWAGGDTKKFDPEKLDPHFYDDPWVWKSDTEVIKTFYIVEIWVRTDD